MKDGTFEDQVEIERSMRSFTEARVDRQFTQALNRNDAENSDVGRMLANMVHEPVTARIQFEFDKIGTPGRNGAHFARLAASGLRADEVAFLGFQGFLFGFFRYATFSRDLWNDTDLTPASISRAIGARIHDELFLRGVKSNDPKTVARWQKQIKERGLGRAEARQTLLRYTRDHEMEWKFIDDTGFEWTTQEQLRIGRALFEVIKATTNLVETETYAKRRGRYTRSVTLVKPTDYFYVLLEEIQKQLVDAMGQFYPCVIDPQPWSKASGLYGGGYWTENTRRYPLIKRASREWLDEVIESDSDSVVNAVNAIQDTPWRINRKVLETLEAVYHQNTAAAGLPHSDALPKPPPGDEGITKEYRKMLFEINEVNRKAVPQRLFMTTLLSIGFRFVEYNQIFFPHDLDSRGRIYPKPSYLNLQGPDFVRGLLEFAEGKPLGSRAAVRWLAIHIANCWGEDKLPLEDRAKWARNSSDMLESIAADPLTDTRWQQADAPFQFLQGCIAWAGYIKDGLDYECRVPIAVDATCSGLQHFSALLRDSVGGSSVNLRALPERQDVYMEVARRAEEIIKEDLGTDSNNLAEAALKFGVTRSMTKRSVMVVPYAAQFVSCLRYTRQGIDERIENGEECPWEGELWIFNKYLAERIWRAISETVIAAREAMDWIKDACSKYAKNRDNKYLSWTTPSGFVVRQRKSKNIEKRMRMMLDTSNIFMRYNVEDIYLDPSKMGTATPPSFIHSLDAAHLCLTIDAALERGLTDFGVVHDSFATHAADMEVFGECIRSTFVTMYTDNDPLSHLRDQLQAGLDEPLPPLPPTGELDLQEVNHSEFFFS